MGQQLIGRPVSQQRSFPTLGTASSPFSPNLSQYMGFTTPAPPQQMSSLPGLATAPRTLGFNANYYRGMGFGRNNIMPWKMT